MKMCNEYDGMAKFSVKVWNVLRDDGTSTKVATIDHSERKPSMCDGCPAPCCKGMFQPVLSGEEFLKRKYKWDAKPISNLEPWMRSFFEDHENPKVRATEFLAVLPVRDNGCIYHDFKTGLCTLYPDMPSGCKAYDCREDTREPIKSFAKERAEVLGL